MVCFNNILLNRAGIVLQVSSGFVFAQEEEDEKVKGSISLGYVGTSGNTETKTFNTEALLAYTTTNWLHNLKFQALGSAKDGTTEAERYYLEDKSDYGLKTEGSYLYGKGTYTDDRFSGFDYQASVSAGYGRHFLKYNDLTIQGYGGVGYRKNNITDGPVIDEAIFSVGEELEWAISETSRFVQLLTSEIGEETTVTKFDIGLETNIVGNIVTKIAFEARHTSKVPAGTEKMDTLTSISLLYSF